MVGEAIGGPEDSCLCADDVMLGIANPSGPPLIAPRSLVGGEGHEKKEKILRPNGFSRRCPFDFQNCSNHPYAFVG